MLHRLLRPPEQSFFLFGARGTGKSTWAHAEYAGHPYFDLLDQEAYVAYEREPGRFGRQLAALGTGETVVVDEIQRIPSLLNEVHRAIEVRRQKFVLLGSSARKLNRAGVNLLGGRAAIRTLFPLLPAELASEFDLEDTLRYGTLPIVWAAKDKDEALRAYTAAYVSDEVRAEALVRDVGAFVRFLSIAAICHGQTTNLSAIARDAGVPRKTVEGYFGILEDTLLSWRLPAFEATPRIRERAHPKVYWIDSGIVRSLKGVRGPVGPEERGALLEGWVANTLRGTLAYEGSDVELSYMPRHGGQSEVDFLLRRAGEIVAIEVKASARVDRDALSGLRSISALAGLRRRLLLCGVARPERTEDGIDVWPFDHFAQSGASSALFGDGR